MTKEQAIAFINTINLCQAFVPPMYFAALAQGEVARAIAAIANGQMVCELKSPAASQPAGSGGA